MEKKIDECEITIIGGGVIGCFIAHYLSKSGKDVVLLERGDIGSGASGANDAGMMTQSKKPGPKLIQAIESSSMWETMVHELDYDIEYARNGSMIIMETEEEIEFMREFSKEQVEFGLPVEFLNQKETRKMQPALSPQILASKFCPLDQEVNPFCLLSGLVRSARCNGGRVYTHMPVRGFTLHDEKITNVITNRGNVEASIVVCAAGAYFPSIGGMLGPDIPIKPRRGQILITEAIPRLIGPYVMSAKAIVAKHKGVSSVEKGKLEDFDLGMIITQTFRGNMVLGVTHEFVGYDTRTSLRGLRSIAATTSNIIPALKNLKVIRSFSGLPPFTENVLPIVGPTEKIPNFIVAAGHEGDGIAIAPAAGKEVAEKIIDGIWPYYS